MLKDEDILQSLAEQFKIGGSKGYEDFKKGLELSDDDMQQLAVLQASGGLHVLTRIFASRGNLFLEALKYEVDASPEVILNRFRTWQALVQVHADLVFIPKMAAEAVRVQHEPSLEDLLGGEDE